MKKTVKYLFITVAAVVALLIIMFFYMKGQPYYKKYHYIAHALGTIDNYDYTNSLEALDDSYAKGFRVLEVDFLYTSDGHLICRHKWKNDFEDGFSDENVPDYDTYMSSKMYGEYTTLDIESLIQFAMDHPDVYFVTDTKDNTYNLSPMLEDIVATARKMGYDDFDKHFIIQFYDYEEYNKINEKFSFQNYIFTLYHMKGELRENGITNILDFCVENNIQVLTLPQEYVTRDICKKLKENDITVYTHTVNSRLKWIKLRLMGVDGIYTDYIYPYKFMRLCIAAILCSLIGLFFILYCVRMFMKRKKTDLTYVND